MREWRRLEADGAEWEARLVASEEAAGTAGEAGDEILEFRCLDGTRPPRRLAVTEGALALMDDAGLRAAYRKARPIGADYYGRPGKAMPDAREGTE